MGTLEYLDALRRAMAGISADTQANTLAYYEQRFIDGVAAGRTEAEVAAGLDAPTAIAMKLRASVHMHSFEQKKNPANLMRLLVSVVGLGIFNLFMVVPALVYAALLALLYAAGLAFYVAGIAITASGLAGANELVLDGPFRELILSDASSDERNTMEAKVSISQDGVRFFRERITGDAPTQAVDAVREAGAASEAADATRVAAQDGPKKPSVIRRAEEAASVGVRITTNLEPGSRATQTVFGLGIVLAGIVIFLLCLVITKYTLTGIRRYAEMNVSLLKGN
ncbi:DUF1700 domain-containing protein [Massilia scottii]|uniref:DUF1700 domain-containing protein n=1 Tax=Massilia scottii TaxID=3057166 RepID=UPI0027966338|nr:DUF1700 domain-containing protein [Massilia sp. CCM 9029]MDQ1833325.1 DUF1700 domain-containing protein [Massilia sp. CCM 9029]